VPSNKCGLIIGKGGETIKNINSSCGVHCEVDKNAPPDARDKNFVIKGPAEGVARAKDMILEKLGQQSGYGGGSSYGGSGGQWGGGGTSHYDQGYGQAPAAAAAPAGGAQDYSQQWAEYYRSCGMIKEAEAIEQQRNRSAAPAAVAPANGNGAAPAAPGGGAGGSDYSAQWAEYYRSMGKVKEAEAIEAQIKQKSAPGAQPYAQPGQAAYPGYGGAGYGAAAGAAPAAAGSNYGAYPGYAYGAQPGNE